MQKVAVPGVSSVRLGPRIRTALVASVDRGFREKLSETLTGLRWHVREAESVAQVLAEVENSIPEAVIVDSSLQDIDIGEFSSHFSSRFPQIDLLILGGDSGPGSPRGPYRQELLYALRRSQEARTTEDQEEAAIMHRTVEVIGNKSDAMRWLGTPVRALGYATPVSLLHDSKGREEVLNILGRLEHGVL